MFCHIYFNFYIGIPEALSTISQRSLLENGTGIGYQVRNFGIPFLILSLIHCVAFGNLYKLCFLKKE